MTVRLLQTALLTTVWLLALGSLSPVDAATGALLAVLLLWAVVPRRDTSPGPGQALARAVLLGRLVAVSLGRALAGSIQVARLVVRSVVRGTPQGRAGEVEVPLEERSEVGASVTGLLATLSPGTVLLGVDRERRVLRFHVLDATDPQAVREELQRLYRQHQRCLYP